MINWKYDMFLATGLFGIAAAFYLEGNTYPATSFLFPSYLAPALGLLAVILGVSAFRRRAAEGPGDVFDWRKYRAPALTVSLVVVYISILDWVGFIAASFVFFTAFVVSMGFKNRLLGVGIALAAAVLLYLLFHVALEVSLPVGSLWESE